MYNRIECNPYGYCSEIYVKTVRSLWKMRTAVFKPDKFAIHFQRYHPNEKVLEKGQTLLSFGGVSSTEKRRKILDDIDNDGLTEPSTEKRRKILDDIDNDSLTEQDLVCTQMSDIDMDITEKGIPDLSLLPHGKLTPDNPISANNSPAHPRQDILSQMEHLLHQLKLESYHSQP